jgi:hypothetical protein
MSSPVPSVVNVPAAPDDTGPEHIDPAMFDPADELGSRHYGNIPQTNLPGIGNKFWGW